MSLGRLDALLKRRGLTWTLRTSGNTAESTVREGPIGKYIYHVEATSIESAVSRTIAALAVPFDLHVIRLPDAASREELETIARAAGCGPVSDPHLGPDGRWRGSAVLLKRPDDKTPPSL